MHAHTHIHTHKEHSHTHSHTHSHSNNTLTHSHTLTHAPLTHTNTISEVTHYLGEIFLFIKKMNGNIKLLEGSGATPAQVHPTSSIYNLN